MKAEASSILARLRTARGHLDSILRMVEEDRYCIDILHQLSAVQGSLDRVRREVFEAHLRGCVPDSLAAGDVDEVVAEVVGAVFGAAPRSSGGPLRCHDHSSRAT